MRPLLSSLTLLVLAPFASAQSFNIDVGDNLSIFPVPSATYGGAASQVGIWNDVHHPYSATLANLDGSPSTVTTSSNQSASYNYFPSTLTGDDRNLMIDIQDLPSIGGPWSWTFSGLSNGSYVLYTYAWAPENNGNTTLVTVNGSTDAPQSVGGSWAGSPHVLGVTYALHHVAVTNGTISVQVEGSGGHDGSINGFQLVQGGSSTGLTFCSGDGSGTACPCGNSGIAGNGCANSVNAQGAHLAAQGNPSIANDTVVLSGTGMPNSSALYFQGTSQQGAGAGSVFGDGLRCAGGAIIRLGTKSNSGGASQYPAAGDASVSVRGLDNAGDVRTYQCWYRNADPTFCTPSTFNLSNGFQITWVP